jgi:hypothetical protein
MTLVWRPGFSGLTDADAIAYVSAVETADGQPLELGVAKAINDFVVGCKLDGIWSAIKASCILAGARTLSGALVPLVGTAPTNFNFVSGDYDRKTGLVGDGSTKYLNLSRASNADPTDNCHYSLWASSIGSVERGLMSPIDNTNTLIYRQSTSALFRLRTGTPVVGLGPPATGLWGMSRSSSASFLARMGGATGGATAASSAPSSSEMTLYRRGTGSHADARLAFYSIGESLDLAALDTRVSALITAIGAAIP